jgi:hypothetical protein
MVNMPVHPDGDELPPMLKAPLLYTAPPFITPSVCTVSITLTPMNKTLQTENGKAILIKGTPFMTEFQVSSLEMQPTPVGTVPDPVMKKPGTAQFITTNFSVPVG